MEVISDSGMQLSFPAPRIQYDCSPEYWCGWVLVYYQWKSARSFADILGSIGMEEIYKLYGTLHEASEDKFVDVAEAIRKKKEAPCIVL